MQGFVEHLNEKKMCGEEDDKDLPFTPDKPHKPIAKPGKYGAAYSTARHLARQAMEKQAKKEVKEEVEQIDESGERKAFRMGMKHGAAGVKKINADKSFGANADAYHRGYDSGKEGAEWHATQADKAHKTGAYKEEVELQEASDAHKVMVTVSDPNHPAVTQRKEQIMKHVIVRAGDKGDAQAKAEAFYKKKGYKVHGSEYHSKQPATSMKTEEANLEEALDKKQELKDALGRHEQHAIDANKRGDDEAVKVHQNYINKIKTKLGKMVQNEELTTKNEEYDMKTFSQFMEEIEQIEEDQQNEQYGWEVKPEKEKPVSNVRKIAGKAYGGAAQKDDEDEEHPVANKATEKRGRGRPKGSTSGARTGGAAKKSYGGLTFHSLSLPNSNK